MSTPSGYFLASFGKYAHLRVQDDTMIHFTTFLVASMAVCPHVDVGACGLNPKWHIGDIQDVFHCNVVVLLITLYIKYVTLICV